MTTPTATMSVATGPVPARRVAVIGAGIAGMSAAYSLARDHAVTLYEAAPRLGGHARTVWAGKQGDQPVDTGFIIFNRVNYPQLTRLFADLEIPTTRSEMSFSVSLDQGQFEYALKPKGALRGIFAQPGNIVDHRFWGLLRDILRFNATALAAATDPNITLGSFLEQLDTGPWLRDRFLLPLSGAIWSVPTQKVLDFPARSLIRFFDNHALLGHRGHHPWGTVDGGSAVYVDRLEQAIRTRGAQIHTRHRVETIRRDARGVCIRGRGAWQRFDDVVLAVHADQALGLLSDPSHHERHALGAIRFQPNMAILHADPRLMPRRRACWASWNYLGSSAPVHQGSPKGAVSLTYWMNRLQTRIPLDDPLFVSLNPTQHVRDDLVYDQVLFHHPVFDLRADAAKAAIAAQNGTNATWFCGAWAKNGFHEDGIATANDVVTAMRNRWHAPAG